MTDIKGSPLTKPQSLDPGSAIGNNNLAYRATRVWSVRRLDSVDLEYTLKHIWMHEDRISEDVLARQIWETQPAYLTHFSTLIDHGFTPLNHIAPGTVDNLRNSPDDSSELEPPELLTRASMTVAPVCDQNSSQDNFGHSDDVSDSPPEGHRELNRPIEDSRRYHRIILREVGTPVHDLRNFTQIFTAIEGGWKGLHAIHRRGHVHRDVGSGNVLLVGSPERGVIMDLGYVKAVDDTKVPHSVNTDTAVFMATEAAFGEHRRLMMLREFATPLPSPDTVRSLGNAVLDPEITSGLFPSPPPPPPFRYNPLHDMESMWWLCMWTMFYLAHPRKSGAKQLQDYHGVFGTHDDRDRFLVCSRFTEFSGHLSNTPGFGSAMMNWMHYLNICYNSCYMAQDSLVDLPKSLRVDPHTIAASYSLGNLALHELKKASESLPDFVALSEILSEPLATGMRRPREWGDWGDAYIRPARRRRTDNGSQDILQNSIRLYE